MSAEVFIMFLKKLVTLSKEIELRSENIEVRHRENVEKFTKEWNEWKQPRKIRRITDKQMQKPL